MPARAVIHSMKTLLLSATLLAATGAVAAPDAPTVPPQNPFAVARSPYERLTQTAKAQFDAQDWKGLQKTMETALPLASTPQEKSDTLRRLSGALFEQEKNEAGRDAAQKMLAIGVASPQQQVETRTNVVSSYINEKNWTEAQRTSAEILADPLTPDNAKWQARFSLGLSYDGLKDDEKARQQLALVVADDVAPAFFRGSSQFVLGESYKRSQQWDEARQHFEAVTMIKDLSGDLLIGAYQGLGEIAQKQNRPDDAKSAFTNAQSLWMQKAKGQFDAKDWDGAITSYKDALKAGTPELGVALVAHLQIGTALEEQEKYDEARAEFQIVVDTISPISQKEKGKAQLLAFLKPGAYVGIARTYIAQQKFDLARVTLDEFLQSTSEKDEEAVQIFRRQAKNMLQHLPPKQ